MKLEFDPFSIIPESLLIEGSRDIQARRKTVGSFKTHENPSWWIKSIMLAKQSEWKSFKHASVAGAEFWEIQD